MYQATRCNFYLSHAHNFVTRCLRYTRGLPALRDWSGLGNLEPLLARSVPRTGQRVGERAFLRVNPPPNQEEVERANDFPRQDACKQQQHDRVGLVHVVPKEEIPVSSSASTVVQRLPRNVM
jgi:hypothetical protein